MTDEELLRSFKFLEAEIDTLRARCDALTIALKHVIRASSDPERVERAVRRALEATDERALFSSQVSDGYLASFGATRERILSTR